MQDFKKITWFVLKLVLAFVLHFVVMISCTVLAILFIALYVTDPGMIVVLILLALGAGGFIMNWIHEEMFVNKPTDIL